MHLLTGLGRSFDALFLIREGGDELLDTWHEDLAGWGDELAEKVDEVGHGLVDSTTKDARMQVCRRSRDLDLLVHQAAQTVS